MNTSLKKKKVISPTKQTKTFTSTKQIQFFLEESKKKKKKVILLNFEGFLIPQILSLSNSAVIRVCAIHTESME